jgi:hypothetical protein
MRRAIIATAAALLALAAAPRSGSAQQSTAAVPADSITTVLRAIGLTEEGVQLNGRYSRGNITVAAGDTVRGPLVVVNGTAEILGVVAGNVHALWGDVIVHDGGEVAGRASAYRGSVILDGGRVRGDMESWQRAARGAAVASAKPIARGRMLALTAGWTAVLVVLGLIVLVLLAANLERTVRVLEQDFGRAFFVGVLGQFGFLPLLLLTCVALAVTVVGILLIPFVLVAAPIAFVGVVTLGWLALALMAGRALTRTRHEGTSRAEAVRALVIGVALLMAPWFIAALLQGTGLVALLARIVAISIAWVALSAGLGAALLSRGGAGRRVAAERPLPPMQGWQTPTPVSGVAAARRPIPARPGATPQ